MNFSLFSPSFLLSLFISQAVHANTFKRETVPDFSAAQKKASKLIWSQKCQRVTIRSDELIHPTGDYSLYSIIEVKSDGCYHIDETSARTFRLDLVVKMPSGSRSHTLLSEYRAQEDSVMHLFQPISFDSSGNRVYIQAEQGIPESEIWASVEVIESGIMKGLKWKNHLGGNDEFLGISKDGKAVTKTQPLGDPLFYSSLTLTQKYVTWQKLRSAPKGRMSVYGKLFKNGSITAKAERPSARKLSGRAAGTGQATAAGVSGHPHNRQGKCDTFRMLTEISRFGTRIGYSVIQNNRGTEITVAGVKKFADCVSGNFKAESLVDKSCKMHDRKLVFDKRVIEICGDMRKAFIKKEKLTPSFYGK